MSRLLTFHKFQQSSVPPLGRDGSFHMYIYLCYQKHHKQFLLLQPRCLVNLQHFQTADKYETAELRDAACINYIVSFSLQQTRGVLLFKIFPLVSHPEVTTAMTWHSQSQLPDLLWAVGSRSQQQVPACEMEMNNRGWFGHVCAQ